MAEDNDIRVQLARIEGKQDVTNERLETANKINDERHATVKTHLALHDQRLTTHGDRLGILETRGHVSDGERRGIAMSARLGFILLGAVPTGAVAIALRVAGIL